ncbi:MAG: FadR family transcriptional regulator [Deltaproteobacteria bacterium]|nr:FadR family transcriptional regulator [Deltaproteobacteria bacterium]
MDARRKSEPNASPRMEELHESLLGRILSDELPAGSKLPPERVLAQEMGTNRSTLREALRRLEQARLIRSRQGSAVTVGDFRRTGTLELLGAFLEHGASPQEKAQLVLDLLPPRAQVVEYLVGIAATRASAQDIEALTPLVERAEQAELERDALPLLQAQSDFMNALVDCTGSLLVRWVANPILFALDDMLARRPELLLFEPSFAALGAGLIECFRGSDGAGALELAQGFHRHVDEQLRALLEPLTHSEEDHVDP